MSGRVVEPGDQNNLNADLLERVRILEANPDCCGNPGFADAVAIRDRSCSWYGCGDGSTTGFSSVRNYQSGGIDGVLITAPADPETGTPGTIGPAIPWDLAQDEGSFQGFLKVDATSAFNQTPGIDTSDDEIDTNNDFSVNLWIERHGWSQIRIAGADSYYATGYYGGGPIGGQRFYLNTPDVVQTHGDPPPDGTLELVLTDGGTTLFLGAGTVLEDGDPHMVTMTYDSGATRLNLYVDGGLIDTGLWTGGHVVVTNPTIGYVHLNGGSLNGLIDEVGVWCTECLTAGDVATLFFAGEPPPPVTASDLDSGTAPCGEMLTSDGAGKVFWGNPCSGAAPFVMPPIGSATVQDIIDGLIAAGLFTQAP